MASHELEAVQPLHKMGLILEGGELRQAVSLGAACVWPANWVTYRLE
jgi:hypothetical protein